MPAEEAAPRRVPVEEEVVLWRLTLQAALEPRQRCAKFKKNLSCSA